MALAEPRRLRSKLFFATLPIVAVGLLFSFVRGAMLGLALGLLYLAFHRYKGLVYGIPFVLLLALFIPAGNVTSAVFSNESIQVRTFSWADRLELYAERPLGTGIGTTGAAAEKAAKLKFQDPNDTYVPDNTWLKVMFELGVLGLWIFVGMLVSMFSFTRRTERRASGIDGHFVTGVAAQFVGIMAGGLVATYLELAPMDQLFWLMIGVVATIAPEPAEGPPVAGEAARALGRSA
jgi:O-antigen ligase